MNDAKGPRPDYIGQPSDSRLEPEAGVLIVTAVEAEADAVMRGLGGAPGFTVIAAGAGPAAAAAGTAAALAAGAGRYACVVSAGIGGGFPGRAAVGSLVVASELIFADLGAETAEGFRRADELGFGRVRYPADTGRGARLAAALEAAGLPVSTGPVLTVSTATGTAETAAALSARVPGAAAEAMEGCGVAAAAAALNLPVLEIRAISNPVGPRDRDAWRIGEALAALAAAGPILSEVLK
ncbi:futalosine hydrolase [Paenibacillus sp. HN-1]|uniref:futalosine hydrolase n=1 Tax=Paenibacillus TaxID=44249 RepID=UPI001CA84360|nr:MULTISPECIES: futalosine hydrolase [Paenibacillus]MBY9077806.1 futalosine hydrolase [Paenibacillus sp. CGMCC 1.18879]MBY9088238.1 futalosine hydrolase [Paenibacillus sinensis]